MASFTLIPSSRRIRLRRRTSILGVAVTDPSNRLLEIPLSYLIDRKKLIPILQWARAHPMSIPGLPPHLDWPSDIIALLEAVEASPTPEELSDLSLISSFWDQGPEHLNPITDSSTGITFHAEKCAQGTQPDVAANPRCDGYFPEIRNPFFYPPAAEGFPSPQFFNLVVYHVTLQALNPLGGIPMETRLAPLFWKIDTSLQWGTAKHQVKNAVTAERGLTEYPFPAPVDAVTWNWMDIVANDFRAAILGAPSVNEEEVRTWTTLSILHNWRQIAARVIETLERRAESSARNDKLRAIAAAGLGAILAVVALPTALNIGVNLVMKGFTSAEKFMAAKGMADAQEAFSKSDSAFAEEVARVKKKFEEAAPQETEDNTGLYVGGVAVLGILGLLLFGK